VTAIDLGDLRRLEPVSRHWGFDRGQPVDRYFIERFLEERADRIAGRVLEIGEPLYTKMFGGDRVSQSDVLDVSGGPAATYTSPLEHADEIPGDAYDCVVCTQTLQFIYDFRGALRTLHRVLRPGGSLLVTAPGITQISHAEYEDSWYWSFTAASMRRLLEEVFGGTTVDITAFGNVLAASAFLYGLAASELTSEELDHADPDYEVIVAGEGVK
jgi:SAM-dependent methyltransferase